MLPSVRKIFLAALLVVPSAAATVAEPLGPIGKPVIPNLHWLAGGAGYIFSGRVKAVERVAPNAAGAVPVMQITFQVDNGFRGIRTGQELVIREWAGLWQSAERYRPGERVMLFLYPPSKLGLTSPVGGEMGRFGVDPGGRIIIKPRRIEIGGPYPRRPHRVPQSTLMRPEELLRALRSAERE
jgi:hypothetical protein